MRLAATLLLAFPLFAQQSPSPSSLKDIFNLTPDQVQKISALYADYNSFSSEKNARRNELNRDLANQFRQPALDPVQIGADYAEAESIRRDLAAKEAAYRTQWRASLTPAQQTQYQTLLNGIALQPLLSEAGCAFLEDNLSSLGQFSFPSGIVSTVGIRGGDFSALLPGFPSVFLPFIPSPPGPDFCGSPVFPLALREYLNPTDTQIAAMVQANADYRDIYQRRQQRIADVQIEIRDENAKERPDPMALGVRYVEIQLLSSDLQSQASQLRQRARTALTGDQAARLKALDDLAASSPALSVLQRCNLLVAPPASQYSSFGVIFDPAPGPIGLTCRAS